MKIHHMFAAGLILSLVLSLVLNLISGASESGNAAENCPPLLWGVALDGHPVTPAMIREAESAMQIPAQLVLFFLQWPADPSAQEFPRASLETIRKHGAIPVLTWEPMVYENGNEIMVSWECVVSGRYDAYLTRFAQNARDWQHPFLLRFAHEMNLARYHWGTDAAAYGPESPEIYKRMFRYVVDLFRRHGADNVRWVFCPNAESVPPADWNQPARWYPGDGYVDVMGMDGYNWGTTQTLETDGWNSHWQSFADIFEPLYRELRQIAPQKPLLVFETASAADGGDKSAWVPDMLKTARNWQVDGLIWFQVNKEIDWRLESMLNPLTPLCIRELTSPAPCRMREW